MCSEICKTTKKQANVMMAAGAQKVRMTKFTFRGTFERFIHHFNLTQYKYATGQCVVFGFEHAFRNGGNAIKIGFNRECHMATKVTLKSAGVMMSHYDNTDVGTIA